MLPNSSKIHAATSLAAVTALLGVSIANNATTRAVVLHQLVTIVTLQVVGQRRPTDGSSSSHQLPVDKTVTTTLISAMLALLQQPHPL